MEVVRNSILPVSMGWCINCHRQTGEIQFAGNEYYKTYENYHDEIARGEREKVTVEEIGGINARNATNEFTPIRPVEPEKKNEE